MCIRDRVYVDPATGIIVDRLNSIDKAEALLFGTIHKWNAVVPWMGRLTRDLFIGAVLLAALSLMGVGMYLMVSKKRKMQT